MHESYMEQKAKELIIHLQEHGFQGYFVGGCVRDKYLGREIHDIDIATNAKPQEIENIFPKTIPTGIRHGTVTVIWGDIPFEVTTFRQETEYENYRKPKEVTFVSHIYADLSRRDFTMNAMALDIDGKWIDPFEGRKDLDAGIIRTVGESYKRFEEDALRILRAIRFSSQLGLKIEEKTWKSMIFSKKNITQISIERIRDELVKLLMGEYVNHGLLQLNEGSFFSYWKLLLKMISSPLRPSLYHHFKTYTLLERMACLSILSSMSVEEVNQLARELKFPNLWRKEWVGIVTSYEYVRNGRSFIEGLSAAGLNHMNTAVKLYGNITNHIDIIDQWNSFLSKNPIWTTSQLAIDGSDLLSLSGRSSGPWIGEILHKLLVKVMNKELKNERLPLLEQAVRWLKEEGNA
ncbi:CCA tRNA nucleotidyltransferase [Microaerobacter geothermalis]|uniref:CCA tRNA nucleotidyltransferase n=1 Tax=Microaerobacter geothermalis TaxID=674972 RepID=UPI001F42F1B5|nr:CCA tRNA nucleotidyltransferase [Microaerobacter geothermalis]MCF6093352.1 CCA tRNA nucleotidyltransferase [Microaerobacter geothermalis]